MISTTATIVQINNIFVITLGNLRVVSSSFFCLIWVFCPFSDVKITLFRRVVMSSILYKQISANKIAMYVKCTLTNTITTVYNGYSDNGYSDTVDSA